MRQIKKVTQDLEPLVCKDEKNLKAGLKKGLRGIIPLSEKFNIFEVRHLGD
ncbi:hypothetical protein [Methanosarcina sp.]|uniref:hypothetical protein n=1 Tax=Methanosarcina sp. TaxID=2213 RepID=UPI002C31387C|nr:hypothetical protein [Methanosarcina sp.]HOW13847.1 hypothetical protein [Methanosarcina sp.]